MLARRQHLLQSWDIHHLNKEYEETGFSIYIYWQMAQCAKCPFYCNFQISNKFGSAFTLSHNLLSTATTFFAQPSQRKPEVVGLECQLLNSSDSQGEHPCRSANCAHSEPSGSSLQALHCPHEAGSESLSLQPPTCIRWHCAELPTAVVLRLLNCTTWGGGKIFPQVYPEPVAQSLRDLLGLH